MKRRQRFRLLFDAAGVMGLVALGLWLWFGFRHPQPQWRVPLESQMVLSLGFSADGQSVFTMKDFCIEGSKLPKGPIIEQRDVQTGQLQKEYPLQVSAEDRALLRPLPAGTLGLCFSAYIQPASHWLILTQRLGLGGNPERQTHRMGLFDLSDGSCITQKWIENVNLWLLIQDKENARNLGISYDFSKQSGTQVVHDLTTGERLYVFDNSSKRGSRGVKVSWDKRFMLMLWQRGKEYNKREFDLEVYRISSWEKIFQTTLKGYDDLFIFAARPDRLIFQTFGVDQVNRSQQLLVYRFDPERGILEVDDKHPAHGLSIESGWFVVRDKYLLATVCKDPNSANWRQHFDTALRHVGMHLPTVQHHQSYRLYDFDSGKLLRQLTGVYEFDSQTVALSNDGQDVIGIEQDNQLQLKYLTLFHIPHYLWEPTWNVAFYVAIVFIVLWPFRFLNKRAVVEIPPVPPLKPTT